MNEITINKPSSSSFHYSGFKNKTTDNQVFSSLFNIAKKDLVEISSSSNNHPINTVDSSVKNAERRKLDDSEIKHLSEKYNVEDMSIDEQEKLLHELKNMGVITKEDYDNCIVEHVYFENKELSPSGVLSGETRHISEEECFLRDELSSNLLKRLNLESTRYLDDYFYWLDKKEIEIPKFKEISKSRQDVYEVLKLIKR